MSYDVIDETDHFLIPDFLISLKWIKNAFPSKKKEFKIVNQYYIEGYTIKELSNMYNYKEWYIKEIIRNTLSLIRHEMIR